MKKLFRLNGHYNATIWFAYILLLSSLTSCGWGKDNFQHNPRLPEQVVNALTRAIVQGDLEKVKELVADGISPLLPVDSQGLYNRITGNRTPVHLTMIYSRIKILEYFIEELGISPTIVSHHGKTTLLHTAAVSLGSSYFCKYLLEKTKSNLECRDKHGRTALHYATISGNLSTVKYLISEGADSTAIDKEGKQPIHHAAENEHIKIIEYLLQHCSANPKLRTFNGDTLLHLVALPRRKGIHSSYSYSYQTINYLINHLKLDPESTNNEGKTPLHLTAQHNPLIMVEYLIDNHHVNPKPIDNQGRTPLHLAAQNNQLETVKYLIEQVKVPHAPKDHDAKTPLDYAKANGFQEIVNYLGKLE